MATMTLRALALLGFAACGELNRADYVGDPLLVITGQIESLAPRTSDGASYVTVGWGPYTFGGPVTVAQLADVDPIEYPAPFTLRLYLAPPDDAVIDFSKDDPSLVGVVGLGEIFVFEDVDGDQQFTPDYREGVDVRRGSSETQVVYARAVSEPARERIRVDLWPVGNPDALTDGYHLARTMGDPPVPTVLPDDAARLEPVRIRRLDALDAL